MNNLKHHICSDSGMRQVLSGTGLLIVLVVGLWLLGFPIQNAKADSGAPATSNGVTPDGDRVPAPMPPHTTIAISSTVEVTGTKRLGMNVGAQNERTGAHLLKNVIRNPGFEAGEYGMIFFARAGATGARVQADWNSPACVPLTIPPQQPAGFWDGAAYEIVSGAASGSTGTISSFTLEGGHYTFYLAGDGDAPAAGDALIVRRQVPGYCCNSQLQLPGAADTRPNSPGAQSLRLEPPDQGQDVWRFEVDPVVDPSSGKLLVADGDWHFEIWARAENDGDALRVRFGRDGEPAGPAFVETIPLTTLWQHIERDFVLAGGDMGANDPSLALTLRLAQNNSGAVLVDDVLLTRGDQANPTVFTDRLVSRLQELRPGILRNWHMRHLGSTLDNQLAEPWARRTHNYRPMDDVASSYHYSIHEFLDLAEEVGAEPWYVIPPTFSPADLQNLVAYLAAEPGTHPYADIRVGLGQAIPWTTVFSTIHLEYGNEMWGGSCGADPFVGASLRGGTRLGEVASDRFHLIRSSPFFIENKFNLVIGSRAAGSIVTHDIEDNSSDHDAIALAPYFGIELDHWNSDEELFYSLFARTQQDVQPEGLVGDHLAELGQDTRLAVYEINFHTTEEGPVPIDVRNDFVTSLGGGLALPLFMLTYLQDLGIRDQSVWLAATYSNRISDTNEYVRVFGTLRDLEATGRKRPTWLGVELANRAIRGDMLETSFMPQPPTWQQQPINEIEAPIEVPFIHSFAFRDGSAYAVMLFNLHLTDAHTVTLQLPTAPHDTAMLHTFTADSIRADNEEAEQVAIVTSQLTDFGQTYDLILAPHSAYVLTWRQASAVPKLYLPLVWQGAVR